MRTRRLMNSNAISDAQRGPPRAAWGRPRGRARAALIGTLILGVGAAASCLLAAEWRSSQLSAFSSAKIELWFWTPGATAKLDSLKIDRSFITGLAISGQEHAMTHTLIQLGKALGLETLAEGVEHDDQIRRLQQEGCDPAQGFLFAAPLSTDALERCLEQRAEQTAAVS